MRRCCWPVRQTETCGCGRCRAETARRFRDTDVPAGLGKSSLTVCRKFPPLLVLFLYHIPHGILKVLSILRSEIFSVSVRKVILCSYLFKKSFQIHASKTDIFTFYNTM